MATNDAFPLISKKIIAINRNQDGQDSQTQPQARPHDTQEPWQDARRGHARAGLARNGPPYGGRPDEGEADDEQARKDCEPQGPRQRQARPQALGQGRIQGQERHIQAG